MHKILVAYFSLTGNTKKIAEAIYESLPQPKILRPIAEASGLDEFDLIFIGFPVHSHSVPVKVEKFLKAIPQGQKVALFSTHGALTGSRLSREAIEHAVVTASQAKIISTFSCRGKVSPQALEVLSQLPEHEAWADMAASASTHPNEHDLEDARAFARWVMALSRSER
ncbi:MAG: flavodoxin family protein [Clostridiales bacterium]|nr:flavodoxin family protein [Clostridiales bacterium]